VRAKYLQPAERDRRFYEKTRRWIGWNCNGHVVGEYRSEQGFLRRNGMQVVILAGGLGTRLGAVSAGLPKALVPVAGRPFVEHQLALLKRSRISDVLFCIGHLGTQVESHLKNGEEFGLSIGYSRENEGALMGTGGALLHAFDALQEDFLVTYGDSYLPFDLKAMLQWLPSIGYPAVMSVFRNSGSWDTSNVRTENGRVSFYSKTEPAGCEFIDYGLLYFKKSVLARYLEVVRPLDLSAILKDLVDAGELGAYEVGERFYEIGKPEGLAELDQYLRSARVAYEG
jgi:NDP-sugar pyrophosphorylase family protein